MAALFVNVLSTDSHTCCPKYVTKTFVNNITGFHIIRVIEYNINIYIYICNGPRFPPSYILLRKEQGRHTPAYIGDQTVRTHTVRTPAATPVRTPGPGQVLPPAVSPKSTGMARLTSVQQNPP